MRTIEEVEKEIGWTLEEAEGCMCFMGDACERCWALGWALGGADVIQSPEASEIVNPTN